MGSREPAVAFLVNRLICQFRQLILDETGQGNRDSDNLPSGLGNLAADYPLSSRETKTPSGADPGANRDGETAKELTSPPAAQAGHWTNARIVLIRRLRKLRQNRVRVLLLSANVVLDPRPTTPYFPIPGTGLPSNRAVTLAATASAGSGLPGVISRQL